MKKVYICAAILGSAILGVTWALLSGCALAEPIKKRPYPPEPQEALGAIVIVLDDVGFKDWQVVPHPNVDALAAQGVTFTRAYANATCSPSRRSLLFGDFGIDESGNPCLAPTGQEPPLSAISLAEAAPWDSSVLWGKWHCGASPLGSCGIPLDHGFSAWLAGQHSNVNECGGRNYANWTRVDALFTCTQAPSIQYEPKAVRQSFLNIWPLGGTKRLGIVNFQLAHGPFHQPPDDLYFGPDVFTDRQEYEAMIQAADKIVGDLLTIVDLSSTLVIVVGDNGTPPQVSPDPARSKGTSFERGIRVPLVIAGGPTSLLGGQYSEIVHLVDLYATVAAWGGGSPIGDGVNLQPALMGSFQPPPHTYILAGQQGDAGVVSDRYKFRTLDTNGDGIYGDSEEFYDLQTDPNELMNLIGDAGLQATIQAHRDFAAAEL